jgi:membrane protein YdbS with pleckstrin-like domain
MKFGEIIRSSLSRADTVGVKQTAVNPVLWLVALITPLTLILGAFVGESTSRWLLFAFAAAPILFMFVVYTIFMFRDPDRLQSEEYRIRQHELKLERYRHRRTPETIPIASNETRIESVLPSPDVGEER